MSKSLHSIIEEFTDQDQRYIERNAKRMAKDMISHADTLAAVRTALAMTQEEVARVLNVKQNAVAQMEKRSDLLISTLRKYVEAMGGQLALAIKTGQGDVILLDGLSSAAASKAKPRPPARAAASQPARGGQASTKAKVKAKPARSASARS